jgi:hypothetical protein
MKSRIEHNPGRSIALTILLLLFVLTSCDDDPRKEDVPELITMVTLTFTPSAGDAVIVTATDPDGEGIQDVQVDGPIILSTGTTYTLQITLANQLADPLDPEYNLTAEVEEEGYEHMFFFSWTNDAFSDPSGDGNVDNRNDAVNYNDQDKYGYPIGLSTEWVTSTEGSAAFRVVLKHQPGLKSATSTSSEGETDLDLTFQLEVQ